MVRRCNYGSGIKYNYLTMIPPLGLLRILIARLHVEGIVRGPLLLTATAQHRRNTKADGRN